MTPAPPRSPYADPIRSILTLAIAPTIGLGICRFAYALVLPDMRDGLGWSYSLAGLMNTINAAGYLAGALGANVLIRRFGMLAAVRMGAGVCLFSLILSALTGDLVIFGLARFLAGFAAASTFVAGGALAANIAQAQTRHQAFYLSLFYTGPAAGILISGLVSPFLLEWYGPGSWWIVWWALAAVSSVMAMVLVRARVEEPRLEIEGPSSVIRLFPVLTYLLGYCLFGGGYIAYMTFMIAYVRNAGGGALAQSAFWICVGIGAIAQPWVWRGLLAASRSGSGTALLTFVTAIGAIMPLFGKSSVLLMLSALVFGNAFFAVVSSSTAFARCNYPREAWPKAIAMMTVAFGIGQISGPIMIGAITDRIGSLSYALNISAATLMLSAIVFFCQRSLQPAPVSSPAAQARQV